VGGPHPEKRIMANEYMRAGPTQRKKTTACGLTALAPLSPVPAGY